MYINCMFYFNTTKASNHSKAISNSYHHPKTHYKICPVKRCSQLHAHHANSCFEQVPNSSSKISG